MKEESPNLSTPPFLPLSWGARGPPVAGFDEFAGFWLLCHGLKFHVGSVITKKRRRKS